jgi:hypothetical protein
VKLIFFSSEFASDAPEDVPHLSIAKQPWSLSLHTRTQNNNKENTAPEKGEGERKKKRRIKEDSFHGKQRNKQNIRKKNRRAKKKKEKGKETISYSPSRCVRVASGC